MCKTRYPHELTGFSTGRELSVELLGLLLGKGRLGLVDRLVVLKVPLRPRGSVQKHIIPSHLVSLIRVRRTDLKGSIGGPPVELKLLHIGQSFVHAQAR